MILKRNPDQTRDAILAAAFEEIHEQGFRGASIDSILRRTGVTKGALYHHFPNKNALGYAVVDEVMSPWASTLMADLDREDLDPIDTLLAIGHEQAKRDASPDPMLGCPVNNLVQEMAALDEGFRQRLNGILETWRGTIRRALMRGQRQGSIRPTVDADATAAFVLAAYQGSIGLAKSSRNAELFETCVAGFNQYLESLRAASGHDSSAAA